MPAPKPHPRRAPDWTCPQAYLQPTGFLFGSRLVDEPRRDRPHPRFPLPAEVSPKVAIAGRRWRPSHLIPPFLALFLMALLWVAAGGSGAPATASRSPAKAAPTTSGIRALFSLCGSGADRNCVVDGATFRHDGREIRIAGIEAPSRVAAGCPAEQQLGRVAADRLQTLLSGGRVDLQTLQQSAGREPAAATHRVTVDGRDVGSLLLAEGHVRPRAVGGQSWCA